MSLIRYGQQDISQEDIDAVVRVLHSEWLTQGPTIEQFENAVARYCDAPYAVVVNSATSALHLACLVLDLKPGDIVWTSPNTFLASANCARYCGANVDFVDIDPRTYNMSVEALEAKLLSAKKTNRLPKIVIPVHFAGQSCDMARIGELAQQYGFRVIEDAAHAIGGTYRDKKIGQCNYSDITVFSFHPVKIITTGEGGMLLTHDAKLAGHLRLLRSHGITRDEAKMVGANEGPWYYEQLELGYNYRITDIQAALGLSQLKRLDDFIKRRHDIAQSYTRLLQDLPLTLPWQHPDSCSAWHLYVVRLQKNVPSRLQIINYLRSKEIQAMVHYIPAHLHPYYQKLGFKRGDFPQAEAYYAQAMTLPLFPSLSQKNQEFICNQLRQILTK